MTMKLILVFLAAVLVTTQCLPNNPIISDDIEQAEENTDDQTETVSDSDIDDNDEQTSKEEQQTATEAITQSDTVSSEGVKTQAFGRLVRLYRYCKPHGADHLYTTNPKEIGTTTAGHVGRWAYKSEGYVGRIYNNRVANFLYPLYRYWNRRIDDHFYTTNFRELGRGRSGWHYEGITGYCFMNYLPGINRPLYRYWNGRDHFYTTNPLEIGTITPGHKGKHGYHSEGVACYVAY